MDSDKKEIEYVVMDPSKNITILVLTEINKSCYGEIAKILLNKEKNAEQVGFLTFTKDCDINICMAGGEFCGNATMSAAVYYALKNNKNAENVKIKIQGLNQKVNVKVQALEDIKSNSCYPIYEGQVSMPRAKDIKEIKFASGDIFPVVFFEGIAHIIIDVNANEKIISSDHNVKLKSNFLHIISNDDLKKYLENNIKSWCEFLNVPALGAIIIEENKKNGLLIENHINKNNEVRITPLVYVKLVDTLYWENSCASGTTAVGEFLMSKNKNENTISVLQPSGVSLVVKKDNSDGLALIGNVEFLYERKFYI